jgi:putative oxidoreductase
MNAADIVAAVEQVRVRLNFARWPLLPIRLIVGFGFFDHGLAKILRGPDHFVQVVAAIGVPMPHFMAWLTILIELVGGLLVIAGAFVTPLLAPMAIILLVAIFSVHAQFGFSSIKLLAVTADGPKFGPPGTETDLLYLAGFFALFLGGPGPLALDNLVRRRLERAERR